MKDIAEYQDYAIELRKKGYNCAQCVLMTLSEHTGIGETAASRLAAPYGSGFSGTGEMCGALSVLGIAEGSLIKGADPVERAKAMRATKRIYEKFRQENGGRVLCRELKTGDDIVECPLLIRQAVRLFFEEHPNFAGRS